MDGKHVRIIKPNGTGSPHDNYKHIDSIVLLPVVDSDYKFIYVDVGSFGKDSALLFSKIHRSGLYWPMNYYIFPNHLHYRERMKLFHMYLLEMKLLVYQKMFYDPLQEEIYQKKIFNYRLSRARRYVECVFGI